MESSDELLKENSNLEVNETCDEQGILIFCEKSVIGVETVKEISGVEMEIYDTDV